jgi:dihydroneopterin triphosphate diphosphatase
MNLRYDLIECYVVRPGSTGHEFLLLRRAPGCYMAGAWYTVAGHIHQGESAVQTAVRELREETALLPLELYCLDRVGSFYVPSEDTLWHAVIFCALVAADAPVRLNPEHDAFRWAPRQTAAAQFLWSSSREAVAQIGTEILDGSIAKPYMQIRLP